MGILFVLFWLSLLVGQTVRIPVFSDGVIFLHDLVLIALLGSAILRGILKKTWYIPRLAKPIVLFVVCSFASLVFASRMLPWREIFLSSLYLFRWIVYASLYGVLIQKIIDGRKMLHSLFWFGIVFSILGLVQIFLYPDLRNLWHLGWDPHYYRLFSTFLDPNFAGIIIVFALFVGWYLYATEGNARIYIPGLLCMMVALYATYSRSSYLAFASALGVLTVLHKRWVYLVIFLLFFFTVLFVPTPGGKTLRLTREDSTISRIENWGQSASMFSRSWLMGYGFDTLRYIRAQGNRENTGEISHAGAGVDSSILFLLLTTGVVGTASYLWIFVRVWQMLQKRDTAESLRFLYVASSVALLTHSLFVNSMFYPWVLVWFWVFVAAIEIICDTKPSVRSK